MFYFLFRETLRVHLFFFFSSRRRHTRSTRDWSSDVCSSDLARRTARSATSRRGLPRLSRARMGASSTGATQGLTRDRKTLVELPNPATGLGSGSARGPQSATSRHPAPKRLPASVSRLNGSRRSRRVLTPPNRLMARHSTSPSDPRAKRRSGPLLRSRRSRQPTALGGRRLQLQSLMMRWGAIRDGRHRYLKIATDLQM